MIASRCAPVSRRMLIRVSGRKSGVESCSKYTEPFVAPGEYGVASRDTCLPHVALHGDIIPEVAIPCQRGRDEPPFRSDACHNCVAP